MNKFDIAIIGGGLGGLASGALLAQRGKKVVLIEQHRRVGGCASAFQRFGCTIEASLHEIDGLDENDIKTLYFKELDVFNHVDFLRLPELYFVCRGVNNFVFPTQKVHAIEKLKKHFPDEKNGIDKYFKLISDLKEEVDFLSKFGFSAYYSNKYQNGNSMLLKYSHLSIGQYLDTIIQNEWLKLILLANISYYHDDPYSLSLIYFSIAQESYYRGCWYIKGGSQRLSDYFVNIIKRNGGEIITKHLVTNILIEKNQAIGLKYASKNNLLQSSTIFAQNIISNTAFANMEKMLPPNVASCFMQNVKGFRESCSCVSIYLIFKQKLPKEIIGSQYSVIIYPEHINNLKNISANNHYQDKIINFVYYSQVDSTLAAADKSVGVITVTDYSFNWDNLTPNNYQQLKKDIAQLLINRVSKTIPISNYIEKYEVATPKTIEKFTLNPKGSIYGFSQFPNQSGSYRPKNATAISNLYMASAWTNPGGGFSGAIVSGLMCANEILNI